MPTLREIDTTFRKLITDQQKLVERLRDEKKQNAIQRHEYKAAWRNDVAAFVRQQLDTPRMHVLRRLTRASKKLGTPIDFKQALSDLIEDSRNARHRKVELIARHGSRDTIEQEYDATRANLTEQLAARDDLHATIKEREDAYDAILDFNAVQTEKGLKRLLPRNKDFFATTKVKARMSNWVRSASYRKGRKLLKKYEETTGKDFFTEYTAVQELKKELKTLNSTVSDLETITDGQSALLRRMDDMDQRIKSDGQIAEEVRELVTGLMEDRGFFDAVATEYGNKFPRPAIETRAKADMLKRVSISMARRVERHEDTIDQLSNAINKRKFRSGLRRRPGYRVSDSKVDLAKITKQVQAQQALGALNISGIHSLRAAVAEFDRKTTPHHLKSDDGSLVSTSHLLLLYVLMSENTDNFVTNQNLGIPDDVAEAAGINVEDLHPDLSGLDRLGDLGFSAGDLGLDQAALSGLDIDTLEKLDIGTIDSGDIGSGISDMGDIGNISIDIPTIDPGGPGGFDGGGF